MKHKVGDTVRIKSKAWIDAQPKDADGHIACLGNREDELTIAPEMFQYAGQSFKITSIYSDSNYELGDMADWEWSDAMLEDFDDIEQMQKRIERLEAEVLQLKGEGQKQDDATVYNANKHYVAIWEEEPYLLKCATDENTHTLLYTFVGMYCLTHRLSDTVDSGQRALDEAQTCMCGSDEQPVLYVFDTGKEALEFMLKYL